MIDIFMIWFLVWFQIWFQFWFLSLVIALVQIWFMSLVSVLIPMFEIKHKILYLVPMFNSYISSYV